MKMEIFELERIQSLWENRVRFNLTESGIHPFTLEELLEPGEIEGLHRIRLGYGQTNGSEELRQAVSRLYPESDADSVLVTNGTSEANLVAVMTLLEAGDEMVLMLPNYMQIWGIAGALGIRVVPFHLRENSRWEVDLDELRRAVSSRTRVIAVCHPNNPTGAVLEPAERDEIVRLAEKYGAWIYADEVYRGAELNGPETSSFFGQTEKVLVCGGLSKSYALPGLRIGWLVGPRDIIDRAWACRDYTSITAGVLSHRIAALVLQPERREKILTRSRLFLNRNRTIISDWVDSHRPLLSFIPPLAGGMAFIRYRMPVSSDLLSRRLREERSVFVISGDCFGMDGYLRLGMGAEPDYLRSGLKLIDEILVEWERKPGRTAG